MIIAYISDLHLEVDDPNNPKFSSIHFRDERTIQCYELPPSIEADVLVIAGDVHPDAVARSMFIDTLERHYRLPVLYVPGNHCCWYSNIRRAHQAPQFVRLGGISFGLATLWTNLSPSDAVLSWSFSDFRFIQDMTVDRWTTLHRQHLDALLDWQPDVIVTHHAPFRKSISAGFENNSYNGFFVNDTISATMFPDTKLWIHGHVHQVHDYVEDHIRVVCNPKGYFEEALPTMIRYVEV